MADITERREVRVRGDDSTFVFAADPDEGRLVIREERGDDDGQELCALTIADREELSGFLQGLRRVLGVGDAGGGPSEPPAQRGGAGDRGGERSTLGPGRSPASSPPAGGDAARGEAAGGEDRQAAIERARRRGQGNAFAAWTPEEERRLLDAVEQGQDLDALARQHGRSRRALELRLERLRGG